MRFNRFSLVLSALIVCALGLEPLLRGQEPATQPAMAEAPTTAPATAPSITPQAQALLDQIRDAYAGVKTLDLAGTLSIDFDLAGRQEKHNVDFTASYTAPNKFRHEMKDDLMLVSDGEKAFAYKPDQKQYLSFDAPKERVAGEELPDIVGVNLQQQNPSLLYAMVKDASAQITAGAQAVDRGPDLTLDGVSYPSLTLDVEGNHVKLAVDPKTHLVRQFSIDMKDSIAKRDVPNANKAIATIDYTKATPGAAVADASFAWTPPADATQFKPPADAANGGEADPSAALVGKPAPAFAAKDLDGKDVSIASLKGSVVVLDFWATWCPPCREGLPHLDQLNKEMAARGVKVYAVNQGETKDIIKKFLDSQKLTLPVLLDESSKVGGDYKVNGIPQTVVIGKDGKVQKVFVGFGPGSEQLVHDAVDAAIKS